MLDVVTLHQHAGMVPFAGDAIGLVGVRCEDIVEGRCAELVA